MLLGRNYLCMTYKVLMCYLQPFCCLWEGGLPLGFVSYWVHPVSLVPMRSDSYVAFHVTSKCVSYQFLGAAYALEEPCANSVLIVRSVDLPSCMW